MTVLPNRQSAKEAGSAQIDGPRNKRGVHLASVRANRLSRWSAGLWYALPTIYLLLALLAGAELLLTQPPGQTPDAYFHLYRAAEIANGDFFAHRLTQGASGGSMPASLLNIPRLLQSASQYPLLHHINRTEISFLNNVPTASRSVTVANTASAVYPPLFYLPQALGIDLARWFGGSVLWAYYLAEGLNGLASVALSYLGLRWARAGRSFLFVVLSLPMALSEYFSISQDALMIASCAAAFGLLSWGLTNPARSRQSYRKLLWGFNALLLAVNLARPVYLPFIVLPLLLKVPASDGNLAPPPRAQFSSVLSKHKEALLAMVLSLVVEFAWIAFDASTAYTGQAGAGINPSRQLSLLINNPVRDFSIIGRTFAVQGLFWLRSFEGYLGWLKVLLPNWAYGAMSACLIWALLVGDPRSANSDEECSNSMRLKIRLSKSVHITTLLAVVLSFAFVCGAEMLTWSPVGSSIVDGVQGRYFLPLAPFLALVRPPRTRPWKGMLVGLTPLVALVLAASMFVGSADLMIMYYIASR